MIKRIFAYTLVLLLVLGMFPLPTFANNGEVLVLEIEGIVSQGMVSYFERGIETAENSNYNAVLIVLDTPGGEVEKMLDIVKVIRSSDIPVIVWVGPAGAQAASAGAVITMAGHAAVMAPETVIGAASPIQSSGEDIPETAYAKAIEDLTATMRSLTENRSAEAVTVAQEMITDARAISSSEALEIGLIDGIASDIDQVLALVDGLDITVNGESAMLATAEVGQDSLGLEVLEQLQLAIANPQVIGLLLSIGSLAIALELRSPGGWAAGFIGVLCLGIAFYGLGQIPANYLGLGLIAVAAVLFVMETTTPTFGGLALAGTGSLIAGLWVLFNTGAGGEYARLSLTAATGIALPSALLFLYMGFLIAKTQRAKPMTGQQGMIGEKGVAKKDFKPFGQAFTGTVFVRGEIWRAESAEAIRAETPVRVTELEGFTVKVIPR